MYMPITVLAGYGLSGVKVTVLPLTWKLPATYWPPQAWKQTSTLCGFTEAALIRWLIVNVTGLVTDTLVAPFSGLVESRVNDPLPYAPEPVVNVLVKAETALPSTSLKPPTDTL